MGSALETLCGQAFGAGQIDMLETCKEDISIREAGKMALYMISLFAYAMNFPIAKFLQLVFYAKTWVGTRLRGRGAGTHRGGSAVLCKCYIYLVGLADKHGSGFSWKAFLNLLGIMLGYLLPPLSCYG
ncbi:hypothetical protein HAX54_013319 [Datura stramonium]|uniref:Uncharacterized protein n=1 Tax=Datura stramonium TaxID=4076 RepID=A0ABS8RIJ7_DATST|nr:hypothetical protein [Datura stramonium]